MDAVTPEYDLARDRAERRALALHRLGWGLTAPLLGVALLRVAAHDASLELIALNALTQWLYLPAWLALGMAIHLRRPWLGLAALGVVAMQVAWIDPRGLVAAPSSGSPSRATFRVMSANLLMVNRDTEGIAVEVLDARPDVLLVQELSPRWADRFEQRDLQELLPYRSTVVRTDSFGIGIYARTPLDATTLDLMGLPALRADVKLGPHALRVFNAHTLPPRTRTYAETWNVMMARVVDTMRQERGPLLLGGDLNATTHARWFRELLSTGLRGAHEDRGRALATTWPNGLFPFPPIRLDHLLVSRALDVVAVSEGEGRGSDHRPIIGDFAFAQ